MTVYKPMTPRLRKEINDACNKQLRELDECEDNSYVQLMRSLYELRRNFLTSFPDGYLLPFKEGGEG